MTKIFVVTGSNKGIGYAIVENLSESVQDAIIYLTARNPSLGKEALARLKSESNDSQKSEIRFHQLDITCVESCKKFAEFLKAIHGGLDVLINNAGVSGGWHKQSPDKQAEECMGVNYYGTKQITEILLPMIRPGGSLMGIMDGTGYFEKLGLGSYSVKQIQRFNNNTFTVKDVDDFVEEFIRLSKEEAKTGQPSRQLGGYVTTAYNVSKAADIAYTKALARKVKDREIYVYGCCPGWVRTDLDPESGLIDANEGADTPVYLATAKNLSNGGFYSRREVVPWPITNYDINKVAGV